jgi:hypothetical protein
MPTVPHQLLFSILIILNSSLGNAPAEEPDPIVLLQGVEESRRAVGSGKMELSWSSRQFIPPSPQGSPSRLMVEFKGDRYTFSAFMRLVVTNSANSDEGARLNAKLQEMQDYDAFVRAGYGRWEDKNIRSASDAMNLCQYGEGYMAGYRATAGGTVDVLFDPRLLGIGDVSVNDTFESRLPYRRANEIKLVGVESLAGVSTHHVSLKPHPEVEFHYWIEESKGFRLHRFEYRASYRTELTVSEFGREGPIPTSVTTKSFLPDGRMSREVRIDVSHAEFNCKVDSKVGTIDSLGIPPGTAISDERIHQRIGFWDGEKLVDTYEAAIGNDRARQVAAERKRIMRWGTVAAAAVVALVLVGLTLRQRLRHRRQEV